MGRPSTKPKDLKDGFYIEVRNKKQKTGIKIYRSSLELLKLAIEEYKGSKEVTVLGQSKNGKMIEIPGLS